MKNRSDHELLSEYASVRSEAAFAELVRRHVDLVYSTALRVVREPAVAQDVSQLVFLAAARDSRELAEHPVLAGWLYKTTKNLAANAVRAETRRQARERKAAIMNGVCEKAEVWSEIEPHLEEALGYLNERDRDLVLLRYFQRKTAGEIAAALNISEQAAQKRVNRAVERLRQFFADRGLAIGSASLTMSLTDQAVHAAPSGLAALITERVADTVVHHAIAFGMTKGILMTTTQKAAMGLSLALAAGTGLYELGQSAQRARESRAWDEERTQLGGQIHALRRERESSVQAADLRAAMARLKADAEEVHRLRGEVTQLRERATDAARGREQRSGVTDAALISWLNRTDAFKQAQFHLPDKAIPELALLTEEDWLQMAKESHLDKAEHFEAGELNRRMLKTAREKAKMKFGFLLSRALDNYRKANNDLLPSEIALLFPYFKDREPHLGGSAENIAEPMLQRYEILQTGLFEDVPGEKAIILAEKAPVDEAFDTRLVIGKHWLQIVSSKDENYWTHP